MRTHYGRPGYRPACGLADVRVPMTSDKSKVDCRRCPTTMQWRSDWYAEEHVEADRADEHHHRLIGERHEYVFDKKDCPGCQAEAQRVTHIWNGVLPDRDQIAIHVQITVFADGSATVARHDGIRWGEPSPLAAQEVE